MEDYRKQAADPQRPVDWRDRLARQIVLAKRYCGPQDGDPFLYGAVGYHRDRQANARRRPRASASDADLCAAYQLRAARSLLCADLEAQLLAGRKYAEIADDLSLSLETVVWYEQLFFDVTTRLRATGFIVHEVLPPRRGEAPQASILRQFAYRLGRAGWEAVRGGSTAGDVPGLLRRLSLEDSVSLQGQLSSAARSGAVRDPAALARLLTVLERKGADTAADDESYPARVQAMAEVIPFNMAHTGGEPDVSIPEFDLSAVELNSEELIWVACGGTLPYAEQLKQLCFPEAKSICVPSTGSEE